MRCLVTSLIPFVSLQSAVADWTHLCADAQRIAEASQAPESLSRLRWVQALPVNDRFVAHAGPVIFDDHVYAVVRRFDGNVHVENRVSAFTRRDGDIAWSAPIDADALDSWASPAVDARNATVMIGSGGRVHALRATDGLLLWQTELAADVVNASVAVTSDLYTDGIPANRAFITDFSTSGAGRVYAINVDPRVPPQNDYDPGEIVWTIGGMNLSGATPAYANGCLVIADANADIRAFDARSGSARWGTPLGGFDGFFGGVTIRDDAVFAATYNFFGGQSNSRLFKLNFHTGDVIWSVPCERTSSIPVVTGSGDIFLSGGLAGFGSAVKIQAFRDFGTTVAPLWDTWIDGGGLVIGGWTQHPAFANGFLYAGRPDASSEFGPYMSLSILDLSRTPGDPAFVRDAVGGAGGPPAIAADGTLYSIGANGLHAFARVTPGDLNCDGLVTPGDIAGFVLALTDRVAYEAVYAECEWLNADISADGVVSPGDIAGFVQLLTGGSP